MIPDQSDFEAQIRFVGISEGGRVARIGYGDDNVGVGWLLDGQLLAQFAPRLVDGVTEDYAVRA